MPKVFKPFKALLEAIPKTHTVPKTLFKVRTKFISAFKRSCRIASLKNFRENVVSLRAHYFEAKPTKTMTQFLTHEVLGRNSAKCVK